MAVHDPGAAAGPIVYEEAHYLEGLEGKRWADGDIREAARANLELLDALGAGAPNERRRRGEPLDQGA